MPRKMSGIAMSVIDASSVASRTPSVQFDSAIHLYSIATGYTGNLYSSPGYMARTATSPTATAHELRIVIGRLVRRLRAAGEIPLPQATVLGRLEREGPQTTSALAAVERVRPQSRAQPAAELGRGGLGSRHAAPADRRQFLLELSEDGRRAIDAERRSREGWLAQAIAETLDPEERATLLRAVEILRRLT